MTETGSSAPVATAVHYQNPRIIVGLVTYEHQVML